MEEDDERMEMGVYFFTFLSIQLDNAPRGRSLPVLVVSGLDQVRKEPPPPPPGCAGDTLQHPRITHTAVPAPISHVLFETSNILSLLINTAIMACQGFMLYSK